MVLVATQVKRRRGTTAENDAFTGAEGEITVDTEKHELRVHDGVTQGGFKIGGGSGSGRNTGDTFITKRTDTNLAGAVECDGATYNTTDFTGDDSIGELLEAGKLDYVSLSAYSDAIAQTGWCDKIGWDGAGNTAFRVPTINPRHYIIKSQEPTAENNYTWYRLYADGWVEQGGGQAGNGVYGKATVNLPITMADNTYQAIGNIGWVNESTWYTSSGAIGGMRAITDVSGATTDKTTTSFSIESFSNHNWRVCGMSSITPQTNTRVMIQLANGATDEAVATCTGVLADVADLKDLSNITATGKETVIGWGMPDYTAGVSRNSSVEYTAESNGFLCIIIGSQQNTSFLYLNGVSIKVSDASISGTFYHTALFPIAKGDTYRFEKFNNTSSITLTFYPCRTI